MGLANGTSRIRTGPISLHTRTAIYIVETLTKAKYNVYENDDGTADIECIGIGFQNDNLRFS